VDISPTSPERLNVRSIDSQMMDTVFEEDETEAKPLLQKEYKIQASNNVESSKPKNESTGITVMTVEDLILVNLWMEMNFKILIGFFLLRIRSIYSFHWNILHSTLSC
jgi:hypothetical protein